MLMMTDRPALHCPGQVQPVAGEPPWPAQSSHLAKTEGGYTLRCQSLKLRHFLINPTLHSPAICVHCTGQVLWVPLPLSVVSLPPNAIFKPHHTQCHGPQPPEQLWGSQWREAGAASNVFRYSEDNLMRGSPSSFSYSWVRTRRVRQTYYQLCKQNVHSPLLCNCWDPRPPTLDWLWLNKWCQGID